MTAPTPAPTDGPSAPKEVELLVRGMHCANCVKFVGDALGDTTGVLAASVDLEGGRALVSYDPSVTRSEALCQVVRSEGYDAEPAAAP